MFAILFSFLFFWSYYILFYSVIHSVVVLHSIRLLCINEIEEQSSADEEGTNDDDMYPFDVCSRFLFLVSYDNNKDDTA